MEQKIILTLTFGSVISKIIKFHFLSGSIGIPAQLILNKSEIHSYQDLVKHSGIGFGRGVIFPYKVLKNISFK